MLVLCFTKTFTVIKIRWAEFQCDEKDMEKTGENMREVLGDSLFLIRFTRMNCSEFEKMVSTLKILTDEEITLVYSYKTTLKKR